MSEATLEPQTLVPPETEATAPEPESDPEPAQETPERSYTVLILKAASTATSPSAAADEKPHWESLGSWDASTTDEAIYKALEANGIETATAVAIAGRFWQPDVYGVKTTVKYVKGAQNITD